MKGLSQVEQRPENQGISKFRYQIKESQGKSSFMEKIRKKVREVHFESGETNRNSIYLSFFNDFSKKTIKEGSLRLCYMVGSR